MSGAKIRTAVIGTGWWSTFAHLPALAADENCDLVAICDRDPERARLAADAFQVPRVVPDVEDVLGDVDAVVVATPQSQHFGVAGALLDAGVDTLVEKPLTINPGDAWSLVDKARLSGARLHVGHTFPYHPAVAEVRRLVRSGALGDAMLASGLFSTAVGPLYRGDTEFSREHTGALLPALSTTYADPVSGGHLYSQLSHAVALLLFVLDEPIASVSALVRRLAEGADVADGLVMATESGLVVTLAGAGTIDHHDRRSEEYRFFGNAGRILLDTVTGRVDVAPAGGYPHSMDFGNVDLSRRPAQQLVAAAAGEAEIIVSGSLGARTVDVLAAARRSAEDGGRPVSTGDRS